MCFAPAVSPLHSNFGSAFQFPPLFAGSQVQAVGICSEGCEGRTDGGECENSWYAINIVDMNFYKPFAIILSHIKKKVIGERNVMVELVEPERYNVVELNLLKPTGHVMHQQFNIQQLYVLPTLYLCVLYLSENKQRLVPLTS